jgi:hypothetical protein
VKLSFSPAHEAFRDEVRRFLDTALTDELREAQRLCPGIFLDYEHNIVWHRILHRQGWVAPAWPKQYGGTGWDLTQRYIWATEATLAGAPSLAPMGLGMCGPMLIGFGSDAQKAYYLPRILSGEDYWCQGYSEPGAGSDLARLALRARRDGDHYVLNGTKIWTTHAHAANRMFLLVRTRQNGRPQQGITFLLLDMDTPGIRVEPIVFASGTHEVNQVFFDDVRVPVGNRVGEEDQGWTVAKYLLEFERGGGGTAAQRTALTRLRRLADSIPAGGHPHRRCRLPPPPRRRRGAAAGHPVHRVPHHGGAVPGKEPGTRVVDHEEPGRRHRPAPDGARGGGRGSLRRRRPARSPHARQQRGASGSRGRADGTPALLQPAGQLHRRRHRRGAEEHRCQTGAGAVKPGT